MDPKIIAEFWVEVGRINWSSKPDCTKVKAMLLRDWSPNKTERMCEAYKFLSGELRKVLDEVKVEDIGDDSYNDLIAHIVGLGKTEYTKNLKNPALAQKRAADDDYRESFSYCIPSLDDYEYITNAHYMTRADRTIDELRRYAKSGSTSEALIKLLEVVINRSPMEFLKHGVEALTLAEELSKSGFNKWAIINLARDIRTYLVRD